MAALSDLLADARALIECESPSADLVGTPTLDDLGAVGGGAHAPGEHVLVDRLPGRTALLRALVEDLPADSTNPIGAPGAARP
ncbi:hypothetical protein AB0M95_39675 [Sphaerisporangium sp. NPDC051017]|uniref:hypothetical protein n=1 Tax=Sphaerisporangium sp. NPDC051017 TaxID=3154636 RepID=UPI00342E9CAD